MDVRRVTLQRLVLAAALVAALASCSSPGLPPSPSSTAATTGSGTSASDLAPIPPGEAVEAVIDGGTVRFTLLSISVATSCPGRAAPTQLPANGYFVVMDLSASFEPSGSGEGYAPVGADVFRVAGPDGEAQPVSSTDASWACFGVDRLLPAFVDVSAPQTGIVVLDSRTEHGSVVYLHAEDSDWSWEF